MLFIQLFLTNGPAGENLPVTPHLWNCYCFISVNILSLLMFYLCLALYLNTSYLAFLYPSL